VKVLFEDDQWFEGTATTSNKVTFDDGEISTLDATVRALYSHVGGTTACAAFEYQHTHMQESRWESHTSIFLYFFLFVFSF